MLIAKDIVKKIKTELAIKELDQEPEDTIYLNTLVTPIAEAINSELHTMKLRIMSLEKELILSDR